MERNGIGMISLRHSAQAYIDLGLSMSSDEGTWNKAIEMVEERFKERYFSTIHYLSFDYKVKEKTVQKFEKNGFAIMALNCLLIDTFYQFEYGLATSSEINPVTGDAGVGRHYTAFLRAKFPELFTVQPNVGDNDLADLFYSDIRCGILHSAQTKGCSMLACEGGPILDYIYSAGRIGIRVDVNQLSEVLEDYFYNDYLQRLINRDEATRTAFINKMRFVCEI